MLPEIEFKVASQGNNSEAYKACEEFIKKWKQILRIQDWEIGLAFLSGLEMQKLMGSDDYNACCARTTANKSAMVSINCECLQQDELEISLLHELLHIVFDEYQTVIEFAVPDKNEYSRKVIELKMEQTIESLAKSFAFLTKEGAKVENN